MNWKPTTRAEALTDGAFAIIMTLLVIEMKPPDPEGVTHIFQELWVYVLSFVFLGTYWIAHYNLFHWIKYVTHELLWMNIWFVAMASLVPLSTAFLVKYPSEVVAIRWYAAHALLILLPLVIMTIYTRRNQLFEVDTQEEAKKHFDKVVSVMLVPTLIALLTLILA